MAKNVSPERMIDHYSAAMKSVGVDQQTADLVHLTVATLLIEDELKRK